MTPKGVSVASQCTVLLLMLQQAHAWVTVSPQGRVTIKAETQGKRVVMGGCGGEGGAGRGSGGKEMMVAYVKTC